MTAPGPLDHVAAEAVVPEQVPAYVCAVAGSAPHMIGACVGYESAGRLVLVGYPVHDPRDNSAIAAAVEDALKLPGLARITVIGPARPAQAPAASPEIADHYLSLPVPPPPPSQKLRNLLRRAGRDLTVERGRQCTSEHMALVGRYLEQRELAGGTRRVFQQLPRYIEASAGSLVVSARRPDQRLAAFAVGEFASRHTAMYMFCFRSPELAPPGGADLLLAELLKEARERGQTRMNLGLAVNAGIGFFKRKWGAALFLPYVEVSWDVRLPLMTRLGRALGLTA
jgi:hypothetical protein